MATVATAPATATVATAPAPPPSTLDELVSAVVKESETSKETPANILIALLRRNHFWPALQVKKFFNNPKLTLLHNTYKRMDVDRFQKLYDECRSVVIDFTAPAGKNVVVTYANSIPDRKTFGQYKTMARNDDVCALSYEGTVITAYEHDGEWFFGTSTNPQVDSSRYFHPTKTHGTMMDEAIANIFNQLNKSFEKVYAVTDDGDVEVGDVTMEDVDTDLDDLEIDPLIVGLGKKKKVSVLRKQFEGLLDKTKAYAFLLVHHQNRHIMDYTSEFGENYAELLQISTRDRETLLETTNPSDVVTKVPLSWNTPDEALAYVEGNASVYGIFVKRSDGSLLKVSSDEIVRREEVDLGNANIWQNLLHVYLSQIPDYHIKDYISQYAPVDFPKSPSPTHTIHLSITKLRDIIYEAYRASTYYMVQHNRYRINHDINATHAPIIKFHVAQLRYLQITYHTHRPITPSAVFGYLCNHNTMKNMRLLIDHVSTNSDKYSIPPNIADALCNLNTNLKN